MWFLYALTGALITGVGQVLVKKGQISLTPLVDTILAAFIINLFLAPVLLLFGVVQFNFSVYTLFFAFIAAAMYTSFYYIISKGQVSSMISLINSFPIVTISLAILLLNEWPNPMQWIGIYLIILGIFGISREKNTKKQKGQNKSWVIWGLMGAAAIGTAEFVTKLATATIDGFTFTFAVYVMYIPFALLMFLVDKKGRKFGNLTKDIPNLLFTLLGIGCIEAGLIAIALAYQNGPASLVSPIVASQLLVTAALAYFLLKDKLLRVQKLGILFNLIGVIIIGAWS